MPKLGGIYGIMTFDSEVVNVTNWTCSFTGFFEVPLCNRLAGELTIEELLQVVQEKIKEREDA